MKCAATNTSQPATRFLEVWRRVRTSSNGSRQKLQLSGFRVTNPSSMSDSAIWYSLANSGLEANGCTIKWIVSDEDPSPTRFDFCRVSAAHSTGDGLRSSRRAHDSGGDGVLQTHEAACGNTTMPVAHGCCHENLFILRQPELRLPSNSSS